MAKTKQVSAVPVHLRAPGFLCDEDALGSRSSKDLKKVTCKACLQRVWAAAANAAGVKAEIV